MISSIKHLKIL